MLRQSFNYSVILALYRPYAMQFSRLSKRVLKHIIDRHPEVAKYAHKIVETVQNPDVVVKGLRGEFKALRFYSDLHIGPKYLVVVYREIDKEKVIITAYFTSNLAKVKGEIIWRNSQ